MVDEIAAVDRWFLAGRQGSFREFLKTDEYGPISLTASRHGTCAFEALRAAAGLVGEPSAFSETVFQKFIAEGILKGVKVRADQGATEATIMAFVRKLIDEGAPIDYGSFKVKYHNSGHMFKSAISRMPLGEGVYVIGAINMSRLGHAFVLKIQDKNWTVHDGDDVVPWSQYGEWISQVSFVKKFEIVKQ